MGSRFLTFVAVVLFGFALMNSAGPGARVRGPELYVSPLAPLSYRAPAAEFPSAILMTEMSAEEIAKQAWLAKLDQPWGQSRDVAAAAAMGTEVPSRQSDSSYDWRMNQKDWRFQLLSMIPFGLLFIAVSLQNSKRAESLHDADECEITAAGGMVPPEYCNPMVAMAAVDGQSDA
jgi:hypothetical protein